MGKSSRMLGYLVGQQIAGQRKAAEKVPIAYLYNGVQLPPLPDWDKTAYPYAFIENLGVFGSTLYVSKTPVWYSAGYHVPAPYLRCKAGTNEWGSFSEGTAEYESDFATWANHDIYYNGDSSENLYLSASDPIPVYA